MDFCYTLRVNPIFHPIQPISQNILSFNDFSIHLSYTNSIVSTTSNVTNPLNNVRTIKVDDHFLIPSEILCNCDTNTIMNADHNTLFLYNNFNCLPTYVLNNVLCQLRDCARQIIALNTEICGIWEMKVLLHVTSLEECQFDQYLNGNDQQIVDLLEKLNVGPPSSESIDRCSICLEEYCEGSHSELIYTKCSHTFHKDCIGKWIHRCKDNSSSYSCPLCRREII
jgi:hypothetical protein